ncbi:MAG: hypothetical protein WBM61_02330, partial [Woeseiaceae bacterium]
MNTVVRQTLRALCLCFLTVLALAQTGNAQSDALTLEEIVSLKRVSDVQMSPKGDRIAYLLSVPRELYKEDDGRPYHELHIVDFDGVSRPYVSGKTDISAFAWSVNGKSIYFLAQR